MHAEYLPKNGHLGKKMTTVAHKYCYTNYKKHTNTYMIAML